MCVSVLCKNNYWMVVIIMWYSFDNVYLHVLYNNMPQRHQIYIYIVIIVIVVFSLLTKTSL